jgi:hypothetical protein
MIQGQEGRRREVSFRLRTGGCTHQAKKSRKSVPGRGNRAKAMTQEITC